MVKMKINSSKNLRVFLSKCIIYGIISQRDKYVYSCSFYYCVSFIHGFLVHSSGETVFGFNPFFYRRERQGIFIF